MQHHHLSSVLWDRKDRLTRTKAIKPHKEHKDRVKMTFKVDKAETWTNASLKQYVARNVSGSHAFFTETFDWHRAEMKSVFTKALACLEEVGVQNKKLANRGHDDFDMRIEAGELFCERYGGLFKLPYQRDERGPPA